MTELVLCAKTALEGLDQNKRLGCKGIVSQRLGSPYRAGRVDHPGSPRR